MFYVVFVIVWLRLVLLSMISEFLLLSLSDIFFRWWFVVLLILCLVVVELVNWIIVMCGLVISVVLVVLFLGSMCSMFLGKLVSLNMCVIVMLLYMVVCGLGFSMIVLLSVSVGVIVCIVRYSGKLNGEIMLIMLCGWWCVSDRWLVVDGSILLVVCDGRLVVLCSVLMVMEVLKDVFVWVELFLCMS